MTTIWTNFLSISLFLEGGGGFDASILLAVFKKKKKTMVLVRCHGFVNITLSFHSNNKKYQQIVVKVQ